MGFHDELFPVETDFGYEGGPGFSTVVQATASGHEERIGRWSEARHRYRANKSLLTNDEAMLIKEFYLARRGALYSFPFKDWHDYTSALNGVDAATNLDQVLGTGTGSSTQFTLRKNYNPTGINAYSRVIKLPVLSTVTVALDGVEVSVNDYSVNRGNGVVTFDTAPGQGVVVSAGFQFHVPVRFSENNDELFTPRISAYNRTDILDIELVETLDETELPETWDPGGSWVIGTSAADQSLPVGKGLVFVKPSSTINLFLPSPDYLPGGRYWTIAIDATTAGGASATVRDDAGNSVVGPLSAGAIKHIALIDNPQNNTKTWVAW